MRRPITFVALAIVLLASPGSAAIAQLTKDEIVSLLKPKNNDDAARGTPRGAKFGGAVSPAASPAVRRFSAGSPAGSPAGSLAADRAATQEAPSIDLTVNFPTGSYDLTAGARASLDELGKALSSDALANFQFRIEGHTDTVGSRADNQVLSRNRAASVISYLTQQYQIDPSRLSGAGLGQDHPLVATGPQTPEARNRRVHVVNTGA